MARQAGLIVAAGALTLGSGVLPAQASTATVRWRLTHTVGATSAWPVSFTSLIATGKHDAWLAGTANNSGPGGLKPLVEHWNGSSWRKMPIAAPASFTAISGFGAASSKDAWAFTWNSKVALHWNGVAWKDMTIPSWLIRVDGGGDYEATAEVFSPTDVLVFSGGPEHYAGRYNGRTWSKFRIPGVAGDVRAVSRDDIWMEAFPGQTSSRPFLAHWNGHTWRRLAMPGPRLTQGGSESLVAVGGARDLWVQRNDATRTQDWQHWNGKTWTRLSPPRGQAVFGLTADGHGGFWATGYGPKPAYHVYFWHRSGGRWTRQLAPGSAAARIGNIQGIERVPGTTTALAAGQATHAKYGPFLALWQIGLSY
ncbi:MAG TPA: hypothetical protein VGG25_14240 [Streptosporangiaceae bacterium]